MYLNPIRICSLLTRLWLLGGHGYFKNLGCLSDCLQKLWPEYSVTSTPHCTTSVWAWLGIIDIHHDCRLPVWSAPPRIHQWQLRLLQHQTARESHWVNNITLNAVRSTKSNAIGGVVDLMQSPESDVDVVDIDIWLRRNSLLESVPLRILNSIKY